MWTQSRVWGRPLPASADLRGRRVLVAEDSFLLALELENMLQKEGCTVLGPFATVADALATLRAPGERSPRPDVAVLDGKLADGLSVPVAERLRALGVPFVLVTAYAAEMLEEAALRTAPILGKPVRRDELLRTLGALLAPDMI